MIERVFRRHAARDAHHDVLGTTGRLGLVVAGVVLAAFAPVAQAVEPFWMNLLTRALVFALFALSLDFVFGYAGLLSFGHAAMFGTAGYAVALVIQQVTRNALVVLPAAVVVGVIVAAIIGWLSVRAHGIYFAMLTLAFAQLFYTAAFNDIPAAILGVDQVTNGDNGLVGILAFELFGIETGSLVAYYYVTLALVGASLVAILRLANSPFGRVLEGIRENEERIAFVGYDVDRYKLIAFSISGGFAGLAGGLFVPFQSTAHPNMLHWTTSGELIVMTLLGGMGTLWGPMLGAGLVVFLEDRLAAIANWEIVLGSIYVVVVIFAPDGVAGVFKSVREDPRGIPDRIRQALANYVDSVRG